MSEASISLAGFLALVNGRRGHFELESGYHSGLWLDLDPLFAEPARVDGYVKTLAEALRPHAVAWVCGPLLGGAFLAQLVARALGASFCYTQRVTPEPAGGGLYRAQYRLPGAFHDRLHGQRVAIVDDAMSAGSALRGTYLELQTHGAEVAAAGALLVLGGLGESYFQKQGVTVAAAVRDEFATWLPADCPLCAAGEPLERSIS